MMLERGLSDETVAVLKSMLNPAILAFMEATGVDLRKTIIDKKAILGDHEFAAAKRAGSPGLRTDSQHPRIGEAALQGGGSVPATLILLFSVGVPSARARSWPGRCS